jgi:hypothetical protein
MVARPAAAFASGDWLSARAVLCQNEVAPGTRRECSVQNRSLVVTAVSMMLQYNVIDVSRGAGDPSGHLDAVFRRQPAVRVARWMASAVLISVDLVPVKIPTIRIADQAFIRARGNGLELGLRRR